MHEEIGCQGSTSLVNDYDKLSKEEQEQHWLSKIDIAMSFDRKDTGSIITHQMGNQTASDKFTDALSDILSPVLEMNGYDILLHDDGGSYTDSNEYIDIVSECTNLSVGYFNQHTENEIQNITFMVALRNSLIENANAMNDKEKLPSDRDPDEYNYNYGYNMGRSYYGKKDNYQSNFNNYYDDWIYGEKQDYRDYYDRNEKPYTSRIIEPKLEMPDDSFLQGKSLTRHDIYKMNEKYNAKLSNVFKKASFNGDYGDDYEEVEALDSMISLIDDAPYVMAYALRRMGMDRKKLEAIMRHNVVRMKQVLDLDELFNKDDSSETDPEPEPETKSDIIPKSRSLVSIDGLKLIKNMFKSSEDVN